MAEYREVVGNPLYRIGDDGTVWSIVSGEWKKLKPYLVGSKNRQRYYVRIGTVQKYVHRVVLEAFVGLSPEGMECCHNNGNGFDNRLDNLRWDTRLANKADAIRHGTAYRGGAPKGEANANTILSDEQVLMVRREVVNGKGVSRMARLLGVSPSLICQIAKGKKRANTSGVTPQLSEA